MMLDEGLPQLEIARRTGISTDAIRRMDRRDRPGTIAERYGDQIAELRAAGMTRREVARRLRLSRESVQVVERESRARRLTT